MHEKGHDEERAAALEIAKRITWDTPLSSYGTDGLEKWLAQTISLTRGVIVDRDFEKMWQDINSAVMLASLLRRKKRIFDWNVTPRNASQTFNELLEKED